MRAFIIILGVTMKAVVFESWPEINGFVEKLVIFFGDQFTLLAINCFKCFNILTLYYMTELTEIEKKVN